MRFGLALVGFLAPVLALAAEVSLDEAFRASLEKNEVVRKAEQQVVQSDEKVAQTRAGIFPEIKGNAVYLRQDQPPNAIAAQGFPPSQTTLSVGLKQPLFRGFREWAVLEGFQKLRTAKEAARDNEKVKLFTDVAKAYLDVLAQEQDLRNLKTQLETYGRRVADLTGRARRGESQKTEVLTAEASQASVDAEARLVEAEILAAREKLHYLTGLPGDVGVVDPNALATGRAAIPPLESLLQRIDKRPDVLAAVASKESADSEVTAAWRSHSPQVDFLANYYFDRPGFFKGVDWDVSVVATIPLFEGGGTQAKVREAVAKRSEMELETQRLRRQATQEIKSAYEKVVRRFDYLERLKHAAELSERNVKLLEADYRRGLVRNIDVQQGLADRNTNRRNYDKARFAAELELYQLQAASASLPAMANN